MLLLKSVICKVERFRKPLQQKICCSTLWCAVISMKR